MFGQFGIKARLHGIEDAEFFAGSTPDFQIWEIGSVWGHISAEKVTRFNPATGVHDRLPEIPERRADFEAWKAQRDMLAAQDEAAREFWKYPDQEWQEAFQEAWRLARSA